MMVFMAYKHRKMKRGRRRTILTHLDVDTLTPLAWQTENQKRRGKKKEASEHDRHTEQFNEKKDN